MSETSLPQDGLPGLREIAEDGTPLSPTIGDGRPVISRRGMLRLLGGVLGGTGALTTIGLVNTVRTSLHDKDAQIADLQAQLGKSHQQQTEAAHHEVVSYEGALIQAKAYTELLTSSAETLMPILNGVVEKLEVRNSIMPSDTIIDPVLLKAQGASYVPAISRPILLSGPDLRNTASSMASLDGAWLGVCQLDQDGNLTIEVVPFDASLNRFIPNDPENALSNLLVYDSRSRTSQPGAVGLHATDPITGRALLDDKDNPLLIAAPLGD